MAVMVTAIAGLWAGGVVSASAAACSDLVLPSNATCNNGTVTFSDGGNTMALSVNSYGNTQISTAVSTNHIATIGVGMADQNNGDVVAIVPQASSMPAGVYFYKRTGGIDSLLGSVGGAGLPAANQTATILVNVNGASVTVYVNGNAVATFTDPWMSSGKVGIGSNGAGYPTSSATFWNILLGASATNTVTPGVCYDQWGNAYTCGTCYSGTIYNCNCVNNVYSNCNCVSYTNGCGTCWNGAAYYSCVNSNNCGYTNCNLCTYVYGTPVPCQCYSGYGQNCNNCNANNNWNNCGCNNKLERQR